MIVDRILGDRVLVKMLEPTRITKSGIVIPDRASHLQPRHGVVKSVGYLLTPDGEYKKCLRIEEGEMVLLPPEGKAGMEIDVDGDRLWVFDSGSLLAVVKEGDNGLLSPAGEVGISYRENHTRY